MNPNVPQNLVSPIKQSKDTEEPTSTPTKILIGNHHEEEEKTREVPPMQPTRAGNPIRRLLNIGNLWQGLRKKKLFKRPRPTRRGRNT